MAKDIEIRVKNGIGIGVKEVEGTGTGIYHCVVCTKTYNTIDSTGRCLRKHFRQSTDAK